MLGRIPSWVIMRIWGVFLLGELRRLSVMDSSLLPCLGTRFLAGGLGCGKSSLFLSSYFPPSTFLLRDYHTQLANGLRALNRYNTFYVFYPIGISSECTLIFQALGPAGELSPLFRYLLIAILVIYVPGMLFLFMGGLYYQLLTTY